jgi:hypothetical protein
VVLLQQFLKPRLVPDEIEERKVLEQHLEKPPGLNPPL